MPRSARSPLLAGALILGCMSAPDLPAQSASLAAGAATVTAGAVVTALPPVASAPPLPVTGTTPVGGATPVPGTAPVGSSLGAARSGMTSSEIVGVLGEPQERTFTHGRGSPEWRYSNGLIVRLGFPIGSDPGRVWQLVARPPFTGATAEGFRLGADPAAFRRAYPFSQVLPTPYPQPGATAIWPYVELRAQDGVTSLIAVFEKGAAISIVLQKVELSDKRPGMSPPVARVGSGLRR